MGWVADLHVSKVHTRVFKVFGVSSAENHKTTESKGVRIGKGAEKLLPSL